jgi:hypothetical protein
MFLKSVSNAGAFRDLWESEMNKVWKYIERHDGIFGVAMLIVLSLIASSVVIAVVEGVARVLR